MHLSSQGPVNLYSVGLFVAIIALTSPIRSVFAIPASNPVSPTVAGPDTTKQEFDVPGLGVELEIEQISYRPKSKAWNDMTADEKEKLKGAIITPINFGNDRPKENWDITAEVPGDQPPYTEIISNGKKNEIGKHGTQDLGNQITDYMTAWSPCRDNKCEVNIEGFEDFNPWAVYWPIPPRKFVDTKISPQVTAAMPLDAVLQVLKDGKNHQDNVLANKDRFYNERIVIATRESFKPFGKIKITDLTDEFFGFFSLLTTYCVLANDNDAAKGPKHSLNIMPRTDFLAMYKKFIEEKLKAEISECGNSLYDIVSSVSGVPAEGLKTFEFKWKPGDLRKDLDQDWDGKDDMIKKGRLNVKKFLDTLQMNDKVAGTQLDLLKLMDLSTRHGQIGGLNDRMESIVDHPTFPAPIFEFRELAGTNGGEVAKRMGEFEDKAIDLHKKAVTARVVGAMTGAFNMEGSSPSECKPKKTECPAGQVPIGGTGKCTDVGPISKE